MKTKRKKNEDSKKRMFFVSASVQKGLKRGALFFFVAFPFFVSFPSPFFLLIMYQHTNLPLW